ncbi:hypothetical protein niasHT_003111 [Heterodera trifolii]|uniref:Uncharacterized protein n=1 Tax=Heterodera trifolii TaxID=157864 RepID=A0ABD2M767_9BILA
MGAPPPQRESAVMRDTLGMGWRSLVGMGGGNEGDWDRGGGSGCGVVNNNPSPIPPNSPPPPLPAAIFASSHRRQCRASLEVIYFPLNCSPPGGWLTGGWRLLCGGIRRTIGGRRRLRSSSPSRAISMRERREGFERWLRDGEGRTDEERVSE